MHDHYDVIVAGGGASGVTAAVAAARQNKKTLLIERAAFLGGTGTQAYVAQWLGFFNGDIQVLWGYPFELVQRVDALGGGDGFESYIMAEAAKTPLLVRNYPFNPEIAKIAADEITQDAGVDTLFHSQVVGALLHGQRLSGLAIENIAGRREIGADVIIDATGDAVIAKSAGVDIRGEEDQLRRSRQPQSLVCRFSNVDLPRFRAIPRETKRELALEGLKRGELFWESMSTLRIPGSQDVACLMSRISGFDALDDGDLSKIEREGRRQVYSIYKFLKKNVPGFENCALAGIAPRAGIRETRRIVGQYTLTEQDILADRRFEDTIALGAGPLDLHEPDGTGIALHMPPTPFEIPMRCLVPQTVDGLIVTGRAISATREANGGARHMGTAMALGQAAGTMAAVAIDNKVSTLDLPADEVRARLRAEGAAISTNDCIRFQKKSAVGVQ